MLSGCFGVGSDPTVGRFWLRTGRRVCRVSPDCERLRLRRSRGGRNCVAAARALLVNPAAPGYWAKPPSWPITRNGRPAGKPYMVGAEEEGLASTATGCLETRIMPEPGGSGCSACSTASPASGASTASPVGSTFSVGAVAPSCAGGDGWGRDSVASGVGAAGGGDGAAATVAFCSTSAGQRIDLTVGESPRQGTDPLRRKTRRVSERKALRFDRAFRATSRSIRCH